MCGVSMIILMSHVHVEAQTVSSHMFKVLKHARCGDAISD
jgi:hypothetical protein